MTRLAALAGLITACEAAESNGWDVTGTDAITQALVALRASPPLAEDGELVQAVCDNMSYEHDASDARAVLSALDARFEVK